MCDAERQVNFMHSDSDVDFVPLKPSRSSSTAVSLHGGVLARQEIAASSLKSFFPLCCLSLIPLVLPSLCTMASKEDLIRLIDEERDAHLQFLSSFIQTPSANPPGDTREVVRFVQDYFTEWGIATATIAPKPEAPNIVSTIRGGVDVPSTHRSRNLVLNGHIDVFPVSEDERWQRDPYSGDIADGFVHGRGGVDMKSGTAADIIAFTYMHRFQSQLSGQCTLEVVSDEETGGKFGTRYLLDRDDRKDVWKGDCVLNAEPSGADSIRFGEKGTMRMSFEVRTQGGHGAYIHRSEGAIRIATRLIGRLFDIGRFARRRHGSGSERVSQAPRCA